VTNEINAIRGAQLTQVSQPILLGKIPEEWRPMIELQREVYDAGLAMVKPGATFGALSDFVTGFGAKRGMKTVMQLHGCGYGDDGPLLTKKTGGDRVRDLAIKQGNVFVWKPLAMSADEKLQFSFGGPVIVTEQGCENLFTRAHGMVEIL
jgi:methionine aminopeptidase